MISIRKVLLFFSVIITSIAYSQCDPTITVSSALCANKTVFLDAGSPHDQYLWSTGELIQKIEITKAGLYSVTTTDLNGCVGSSSVVVNQIPALIPNVSASSGFVCLNDEVELSATGAGPGGTYEWNQSLGFGQTVKFKVLATLTYEVTLTDVNNCTAIGAIKIASIDTPSVTVSNDALICKGASVVLEAKGADEYRWFPSSGLSNDVGPSVIATPNQATDYTVVGYNELGGTECSNKANVKVILDTIEVSLPVPETVCKDEEVTILSEVKGGVSPYSYKWTVNNILRTENTSSIIDVVNFQSVYRLVVEDALGCTSTSTTTYNNYPPLKFEYEVNKEAVCPNDPVFFNATITGGSGVPYQFIFDGNYSTTAFNFYPDKTYAYPLIAKDGCKEIKDTLKILTYPIPHIDFIANEYYGCQPKIILFTPVTNPPGLESSYKWSFGDLNDSGLSISHSPSHTYEMAGDYTVKLEILTIHGCFIDTLKENLIHINPLPNLSFSAEPPVVSIYKPVIYFNNQSENKESSTYFWNFGNGQFSKSESPNYTFPTVGEYVVTMEGTNQWGCKDTVTQNVEVMPETEFYIASAFTPDDDGINEIYKPAVSNILEKDYQFKIYARDGFAIFETDKINEGWNGFLKNGGVVKSGVYVYHITYRDVYEVKHEESGTVTVIY